MKKIITHTTPSFHSDDVFAVAVFDILYKGEIEIVRTHDKDVIASGDVVVDIGGEYDPEKLRFDHHQKGGAGERDGIQYASIGLVWKHFGEELSGSKEAAELTDKRLIQPIDANDNGQVVYNIIDDVKPYVLQDIIGLYRDYSSDEEVHLKNFKEAVKLAKFILLGEIKNAQEFVKAKEEAHQIYKKTEDKRVIVFDNENHSSMLRIKALAEFEEPIYIIYPDTGRGSWRVKAIQTGENGFEMRKPFPESWAGLYDENLQEVTGVNDATFCHRGLFTAAAKTKEGVIKLAYKSLEN